jgi:(E)-4-hydroxy-3-methylbut-2-enyl-diphosphate synthase
MNKDIQSLYCLDLFNYQRSVTQEVTIGTLRLGNNQPIRVQSMTNTSTLNSEASIAQAMRIIDAGGELVRLTAQGVREAENLQFIRKGLFDKGYRQPLSADIHFNPNAAEVAAQYVEKVRINPGNFVDAARTFRQLEYTDKEYQQEIQKIRNRLLPLLSICKTHHTALRIGVNHGSLSDRIMSRYGNSPAGMVESCMEFLRICEEDDFHEIVISIKASNTLMMVQTVRLLVSTMQDAGMSYPIHLGVTEAGDGEDGRIKSAVGIGALLVDGIGDTIRVSLSEDPEKEIPVARKLIDHIMKRVGHTPIKANVATSFNPYVYHRRDTSTINNIGSTHPPLVVASEKGLGVLQPDLVTNELHIFSINQLSDALSSPNTLNFLKMQYGDLNEKLIDQLNKTENIVVLLSSEHPNATAEMRAFFHALMIYNCLVPVFLHRVYNEGDLETFQVQAAADLGVLFLDGFGDGLFLENALLSPSQVVDTAFAILQASRVRVSKTDYISCPGCGRTLFDLQTTLSRIKEATGHLVGLKIGVMGCIVNGPGEMADADFGYVGAGKGRVSLYHHHQCIEKNIPEEEAVDKLLALIEKYNVLKNNRYEILFFLENDSIALLEVKRLDLDETADTSQRYQWFLVEKKLQSLSPLTFVAMTNDDKRHERVFEQGTLQFDELQGTFEIHENMRSLLSCKQKSTLDAWIMVAVDAFFHDR